jgi:hypothetical protein
VEVGAGSDPITTVGSGEAATGAEADGGGTCAVDVPVGAPGRDRHNTANVIGTASGLLAAWAVIVSVSDTGAATQGLLVDTRSVHRWPGNSVVALKQDDPPATWKRLPAGKPAVSGPGTGPGPRLATCTLWLHWLGVQCQTEAPAAPSTTASNMGKVSGVEEAVAVSGGVAVALKAGRAVAVFDGTDVAVSGGVDVGW